MSTSIRTICGAVIATMLWVPLAPAQALDAAEAWRALAMRLEPGTEVKMRLQNGQHFRATVVAAEANAIAIQPRTRRAVPVQRVDYAAIASLERREAAGLGAAKAALIGASIGAGAGFAVLLMLIAAYGD
jgi:hypothetical protein